MSLSDVELLQQFERRSIDPNAFGHREHLRVAYLMLDKYPFMIAAARYTDNIDVIATAAGAPTKANVTITFAFMSLIAERKGAGPYDSFDAFLTVNPDLMSTAPLKARYSDARLSSELARTVFLMPDKASAA